MRYFIDRAFSVGKSATSGTRSAFSLVCGKKGVEGNCWKVQILCTLVYFICEMGAQQNSLTRKPGPKPIFLFRNALGYYNMQMSLGAPYSGSYNWNIRHMKPGSLCNRRTHSLCKSKDSACSGYAPDHYSTT